MKRLPFCQLMSSVTLLLLSASLAWAQTAATGALTGKIVDPSGAVVPEAQITVTNESNSETRTVNSSADGLYSVPLLAPGAYGVMVSKAGFAMASRSGVQINVTETTRLDIGLEIGNVQQSVSVSSEGVIIQTESSALGRVVNQSAVEALPLVARNYTQIVALSPGIVMNVNNAGDVGMGTGGQSNATDSIFTHGLRSTDNSFLMDGVDVSDLAAYTTLTGGVAIPNPDTIEQFKVQTGQYDASYGRTAGANISIITKGGANQFHGALFEFFRNEALNANDFFLNRAGQPRAVLRQNQFGFTFGGPIKKDKLFFFGSYQGTRQSNGLSSISKQSVFGPPLTNDRSRAALGTLFGGMSGQLGGTAVLADGSNINPIAFNLLNLKLSDGSYFIKTPQTVDTSRPFLSQGFSAFSSPASFTENQYMVNLDYVQSEKSKISGRMFWALDDLTSPFSNTGQANLLGFPQSVTYGFWNLSLSHTYTIRPNLLNEARFGFHRTDAITGLPSQPLLTFSQLGIAAIPQSNEFMDITIFGSYGIGGLFGISYAQNNYLFTDSLSYVRGRHTIRVGGGVSRDQVNFNYLPQAEMDFLSFPDFLLGQDGTTNGSGFSNVFDTFDDPGLFLRNWRVLDATAYVQDDVKLTPRLTMNLGFRYERLGGFGEINGRNAGFDPRLADPNPPSSGTLAGFTVSSNFPFSIPPGVTKGNNEMGIQGLGQNQWEPRIGFAWQALPHSTRMVIRGGYGIYASRVPGATQFTSGALSPPFTISRFTSGASNAQATFANPFQQPLLAPSDFPQFFPYSPKTSLSLKFLSPGYQPTFVQSYGLGVQAELARDYLLEVGYIGNNAIHLIRGVAINQAGLASTANPIRGVTTNTVNNIPDRVPLLGFQSEGLYDSETEGYSWYNGLEASLTKRFSKGFQFLVSYTFSKLLDTDPGNFFVANGGETVGNQDVPRLRYGRDSTDRTHRLVISYLYSFPNVTGFNGFFNKMLSGWSVSGVTIFQSGLALTLTGTNGNNVYGITNDLANLAPGCSKSKIVTPGSVNSKLNNYFNTGCFAPYTVIGNDGTGTAFGNAGAGIVNGPDQRNFDIALIKKTAVGWPNEVANVEFRTEFFNAFNTPQFDVPVTQYTSSAFGTIGDCIVNPRLIQFALKLNF